MSVYLVAGAAASTTAATLADHLPTARARHYPSDTSDAEWQVLAPHVPAGTGRGRPIIYPRRDIVDAIRYLDPTAQQVVDYALAFKANQVQRWLVGSEQRLSLSGTFGANRSIGWTVDADGNYK